MNILICGGGTAGHITPGIAIAKEIKQKSRQNRVLFIGRQDGAENELISNAGFPYTTLDIHGLYRRFTIKNIDVLQKAVNAKREAKKIIKAFSPDAIIGTGGYVCWPVLNAGYSMNIPIFIHESNIYPGLTTRLLSKKCNKVFLYSEDSAKYLPKKTKYSVVGNPIPKDFFITKKDEARRQLGIKKDDVFILSFGGSLGAEKINEAILNFMKIYSVKQSKIHHIHATGKAHYSPAFNTKKLTENNCMIVPFLNEMYKYMKAADIVICRSGAMTLTELSACATAAILIPSPNVSDNHQYKNAMTFAEKNAAIVIPENELCEKRLVKETTSLVNNSSKRQEMSKCIELFAKKDVEKSIFNEIVAILES